MNGEKSAPFARGETYYGLAGTIPSTYGPSVDLEGRECASADVTPGSPSVLRSKRTVHTVIVRNTSGVTLLAGSGVVFASGYAGKRVDGCSRTTGTVVDGIVDDCLPSGVRNGDLFHMVVEGPCLVDTPAANMAVDVAVGSLMIAATAAASTNNTLAGKVLPWLGSITASADTTVVAANAGEAVSFVANAIGRAMSARVTNVSTGSPILVNVKIK